jgi:hypothetical protein
MLESKRIGHRFRPHAAAVAALLLATVGPASAATISNHYLSEGYIPGEAGTMSAHRDVAVYVVGDPFGAPDAALSHSVASALRANPASGAVGAAMPAYRVIVLFGPGAAPNRVCATDIDSLAGGDRADRVVATFCRGEQALTQVVARGNGFSGPDDPDFTAMFRQIGAHLFPRSNPNLVDPR